MASFVIKGGKKLQGEVKISGSKNAALPILAGCIINKGITRLYNVPNILDTKIMLEILEVLGCKVKKNSGKIVIDSRDVNKNEIPFDLMKKMRSSVILAGALISRKKEVLFSYPGGCNIGSRPIDMHLDSFEKLGIEVEKSNEYIRCKTNEIIGTTIKLKFPSVGATENIILAAIYGKGNTIIENPAMEPEIIDLQNFLNRMGAKISGAGTERIVIKGVKQIKNDFGYNIMPDRIEAGTFLCIAAGTKGKIKITNVKPEHIKIITKTLSDMGCKIQAQKNSILLEAPKKLKSVNIETMPYPGFPTDMQSIFLSIIAISKGTSEIMENIFESRYKCVDELKKMGAKIKIEDRKAIIKGKRKLHASKVKSTDLRGGAALIVAATIAKGKTEIKDVNYILRGYENIDEKLKKIGVNILLKEGD